MELRPGREEDLAAVAAIVNAADAVERFGRATSGDALRRDWEDSGVRPERDLVVAVDPDGGPVGYALLTHFPGNAQHVLWGEGTVLPARRRQGIGSRLMAWVIDAARSQAAGLDPGKPVVLQCYARDVEAGRLALFAESGLRPSHEVLDLVRTLEELSVSAPTPNLEIRPFRPGEDDEGARRALNEAFSDDPDYVPRQGARWTAFLATARTDLWTVSVDREECSGLSVLEIEEERNRRLGLREGLVSEIAVRPAWRGRGFGRALLIAGLRRLREEGMETVHLFVETANPTGALRLYRNAGFATRWRCIHYRTTIRE